MIEHVNVCFQACKTPDDIREFLIIFGFERNFINNVKDAELLYAKELENFDQLADYIASLRLDYDFYNPKFSTITLKTIKNYNNSSNLINENISKLFDELNYEEQFIYRIHDKEYFAIKVDDVYSVYINGDSRFGLLKKDNGFKFVHVQEDDESIKKDFESFNEALEYIECLETE